jgi:hypothetical protein
LEPLDAEPFVVEDEPVEHAAELAGVNGHAEFEAVAPFTFDDADTEAAVDAPFDFSEVEQPAVSSGYTGMLEAAALDVVIFDDHQNVNAGAESVATEAVGAEPALDQPGWAGREGLGDVARKVLWPQFVNQTSTLIDRAMESENLFQRIAMQKVALQEMGVVPPSRPLVVRQIASAPETEATVADSELQAAETAEHVAAHEPAPVKAPAMSEQTRMDLMGMRIRLIEDEDAAPEIAKAVEQAMSEGLYAPLAMRVLGEAYLKMGLVERAAAQFRQAMLARRKSV